MGTHKNQILALHTMEQVAFEGMQHYTLNSVVLSVPYHQRWIRSKVPPP